MILNRLKDTKGFMSLEAILGMGVILMVIVLGIGFFSYMMPKQGIEQEVNLLGRLAKMNGGLTVQDVQAFKGEMAKRGYEDNEVKLDIQLKTSTGVPVMVADTVDKISPLAITGKANATPLAGNPPHLYIHRSEQLIMEIRAEMPSNKQGLLGAFWFFNVDDDSVSDSYVFKERVMSERH
jgi:hypothetical protein